MILILQEKNWGGGGGGLRDFGMWLLTFLDDLL